ncbi:twin-arginine translocation signal domain-containing protein [Haloarcula marina]|uniref:twin-arginine translocation signal domain-containing protein n=1 Tax=Haloarcula marina TaxID=2961574 RepID=UPI0020B876C7|nr:twin-arginine translocation signal domain-containing protein [Halomicroarcula marina]
MNPNDETTVLERSRSTATRQSRRRFLQTVAVGSGVGLAGCLSRGAERDGQQGTAESEAISDLSFEGEDLVLTATEGFHGSELHVVDPTETVWAKTSTEHTTGKARIPLLDVDSFGDDNHYTPGTFQFVFNPRESESYTEHVELVPKISVIRVEQFGKETPLGFGRIAIAMQNSGTGPTWISDITYEGAPNYAANDEVSTNTFPSLHGIEKPTDAILQPQSSQTYLSRQVPLRFLSEEQDCSPEDFSMILVVSTPRSDLLRYKIEATKGGKPESVSLIDAYVCSDVQLTLHDEVA